MMREEIRSILVRHLNALSENSKNVEDHFRHLQKELAELLHTSTNSDSKGKNKKKKKEIKVDDSLFWDEVIDEIIRCTHCIFLSESQASDSVLDFMVSLLLGYNKHQQHVDQKNDDTLFNTDVLDVIQAASRSNLERLRVESCRWIGALARRSIFLSDLLLPRLLDKAQAVRQAALHACVAFPNDSDLRVENILWNVHHDPSAANRCAALESLVLTNQDVIPYIVRRLRDVHPKVRSTALRLLQQIPLENFTPDQCASIIGAGLSDRCKETYNATATLISTRWMKSVKYDPIALLSIFKPSKFEAECEKMILSLLSANAETLKGLSEHEMQAFYKNMSRQPAIENLSASNVFLARLQCQNESSQTKKNEMIQTSIPDVHILCQAIQSCLDSNAEKESTANTFCCNQLFKFAQLMDLQEEGSRRHFVASCSSILTSTETPDEILEDVVKALSRAHDREEEYLNCIGDIVDNMHDQLRILSILTLVLEFTTPRMVSHASLERFIDHIVPPLSSNDVLVREASVSCLGRLALLSGESIVMEKYKSLLLSILSMASEKVEIRAQAMLALSDLTLLYEGTLRPIEVEGRRLDLIEFVTQMLQHENPSVIAVAAEVAIKLLFSGKVQDLELVASLVVIFFNKNYEDYDEDEDVHEVGSMYRMQQLLSLFFPSYVIKGHDLTQVILPMLNKVAIKKRGRKSFPIVRMIEFVYSTSELGLEERGKVESKVDDDKKDNALLVCLEISKFLVCNCDNLSNTTLRTLCKILGGADVDLEQSPLGKLIELKWSVHELTTVITDGTSLESLETMAELLEDIPEKTTSINHNQENEINDAKVSPSLESEGKLSESSSNAQSGRTSSRRRQALEEVN